MNQEDLKPHDGRPGIDHQPEEDYASPPPYARTMAIARWLLLGALTVFALVMALSYFGLAPWAGQDTTAAQYHCPMHPTYITSQPGDCPICGMSLVPISQDGVDTAHQPATEAQAAGEARPGQYTCPMHPEVVSDEPGRCPDCGMFLEQVPGARPGQYTCPMHPEVVSDEPGRCPDCGMFLEQVPSSSGEVTPAREMDAAPSSDVPGLVPVTIAPERLQMIGLKTATVEHRALGRRLRLVGFVTPDETRTTNVHVRVSGWVSKLFADQTGQLVKAGEPLLSIYSQDLYQAEQDLLVARDAAAGSTGDAEVRALRDGLLAAARERLRLLGLSPEQIEAVESSDLPSQELTLESPATGYVLEKSVIEGQYIDPSSALYTIADLSHIWVLVDVYERDFPGVRVGQAATMRLAAFPGEEFEGTVSFIYPTVSEQTRTLKLRLEFANLDLRLRPGMYADVHLDADRRGDGPLAVPAGAVLDGGETQYAFVVHGGVHFEPRLVRVGKRSDDFIEIVSGLVLGDTVVTSANFLIDSESRLKAAIAGMSGAPAAKSGGHQH
jgi:RND family efflux transporter MFP subunit